ncbi:hypothetical protein L228DRAFT_285546 [Xylona heveae TC161]|uniref:Prolyl 4-hydroxylase alpha subunit domain-containing protein n=1 Tax=Xylona heveae (strain CBS 132557 / TC161) TaxID=1328760 RepID=A0A164ZVX8_XYLHT|nr:hypothetical protein L228DRAFT_285546 [Xylona heveae TC161]KZF19598.1 hypothetical protein L228DRAFT_285546 [Xylona heveae TC161]
MPPKGSKRKDTAPASSAKSATTTIAKSTARPNWPPLEPLVPNCDLSLSTLVENQIITIPNFFTASLCKTYVSFLSSLPFLTTPAKPKKGDAVRVNDRFQIEDPAFAEQLWNSTALKDLVCGSAISEYDYAEEGMSEAARRQLWGGEVVGLNPNIRIYRYRKGQFFAQHYDESNKLSLPTTPTATPAKTTWTLLIYLTSPSSGCIGGETVFYPDPSTSSSSNGLTSGKSVVVSLETGTALLHKHGEDCMLHEGLEVKEGEKWVIRSDLCVRR